MAKRKQPQPQEKKEVAAYQPTGQEQAALNRLHARENSTAKAPRIKVEGNVVSINHPSPYHGWGLLMEAMGTVSGHFSEQLLKQMVNALTHGKGIDQEAVNFALAVVAGIKPRDELETMLVAQMTAIHCATMNFSRRLNHVTDIDHLNSVERTLNKLARTFTTQMEALKKYRGGEQKITVQHQHVTVNDGGQAIIGNVEQGKDRGEG